MRIIAFIFIFLASAGTARAASFCVAGMSTPPQCLYEDITSCERAADPPNTFCEVNATTRLYYYGSGRYCAVQSNRIAQCLFNDPSQCYEAVFQDKSVCVDREASKDNIDPYRYDQRLK